MGFTRAELESFRDATVPDLVGPGLRLLFVGINPGLWTAATQTNFADPGNRFYPALRRAGIIDRDIDRGSGLHGRRPRYLVDRGIGITNLVARATPRAAELSADEWPPAAPRLRGFVANIVHRSWPSPVLVPIARRSAMPAGPPRTAAGDSSGAELWVVPNPSGLNAHRDDGLVGCRLPSTLPSPRAS